MRPRCRARDRDRRSPRGAVELVPGEQRSLAATGSAGRGRALISERGGELASESRELDARVSLHAAGSQPGRCAGRRSGDD
jgi:hypothetical protein